MLAGVAWAANPAVTRWAGRPDTTVVTIVGTALAAGGTGPTWAYYEDFEGPQWFNGAVPDTSGALSINPFSAPYNGVAANVTQLRWMSGYGTNAEAYGWALSPTRGHSGTRSLMFDATRGKVGTIRRTDWQANAWSTFGVPSTRILPSSATELFVSCWWYDLVDTTNLNLAHEPYRVVMSVEANAADANIKAFFLNPARFHAAHDSTRLGTMVNTTYDATTLLGSKSRYKLLVNQWNRSDLWAVVGNGTTTSRLYSSLNYAVLDSTGSSANLGASNHFDKVKFNGGMYFMNADSTRSMPAKTFYDDIYISDSPCRVELGDKIVYRNCTKRYIQPLVSWSDTQVQFRPVLKDLTYSGATASTTHRVYVFIIGPSGLGSRGADNVGNAIDSLEVLPPEFSAKATASNTLNAIVQATVDSFSVYNPNLFTYNLTWYQASARSSYTTRRREPSSIVVNWGDSTTPTTATRTYAGVDSVFTHAYAKAGSYTISVTAANAAGSVTRTKAITVKDGSTRRLTAVGTIALPNNVFGINQTMIQPLVGDARIRTKRNGIWDSQVWTVQAPGGVVTTGIDSLRILNITAGDTIQVQVF
jgi:PKD repeat protein